MTISTSALASSWKWLTGWQQHERLVAQGLDLPAKTKGEVAPGTVTRMQAMAQGIAVPPVQ